MNDSRVIIIGGSSNSGKTTLAGVLAQQLGWRHVSTDYLARHPGRPWSVNGSTIPPHVVEHYSTLSCEELLKDVLFHYRNLEPKITSLIAAHATDISAEGLVLEGSALWPEFVVKLPFDNIKAVWLTAGDELFRSRIYNGSRFEQVSAEGKILVDNFLQRTLLYNEKMMEAVNRLGLTSINIESRSTDDLCDIILRKFGFACPLY